MPRKKKKSAVLTNNDYAAIAHVARSGLGFMGMSTHDLNDIKQELAIYLFRNGCTFNRRKGKWSTFRGIILEQAMAKIIRNRNQKSSIPLSPEYSVSLNIDVGGDCDESIPWIECVNSDGFIADGTEKPEIAGIDLKIDVAIFVESIPKHLKRVCLALQKMPPNEASMKLNISERTLYRRIGEIRELMIAAGFEAYLQRT